MECSARQAMWAAAALLASVLPITAARADPAVDQGVYVSEPQVFEFGRGFTSAFQTFTAGQTGALSWVLLQIATANSSDIGVEIYRVPTTGTMGNPLGIAAYADSAFGAMRFTTDVFVTAGEHYAILATSRTNDARGEWRLGPDAYAGGAMGFRYDQINAVGAINMPYDLGFFTFVDPDLAPPEPPAAPVPEPAGWLTMIGGLFAAGHVLRSRNRTTMRYART